MSDGKQSCMRLSRLGSVCFCLFVVLLLILFTHGQAYAQTGKPPGDSKSDKDKMYEKIKRVEPGRIIKTPKSIEKKFRVRPPVPIDVQLNKMKINAKNRIPYTELQYSEFRNPKTGMPLKAEDRWVVTRNGKKVTISGAQFIAQAREYDKGFSPHGHSLRQRGEFDIQTSMLVPNSVLAQMTGVSMSKYKLVAMMATNWPLIYSDEMITRPSLSMLTASQEAWKQMGRIMAQQLQDQNYNKIKHDQIKPFNLTPWNYKDHWGDRSTFAASIDTNLIFSGTQTTLNADTTNMVKVTTFGKDWTICDLTAHADTPTKKGTTQQMNAKITVNILGDSLIDWHDSKPGELSQEDDQKFFSIDKKVEFYYVIVVIPVKMGVGFKGESGVRYAFHVSPLYADAKVTPYINTWAYAECSIDAFIAEGGVEGNLTLLKDTLDLGAKAGIGVDEPEPYFYVEYYGRNNIETLSGSIKAFAKVDLILWSNKWNWTLFHWDGFKNDGFVIPAERMKISLYEPGKVVTKSLSKKLKLTVTKLEITDTNYRNEYVKNGSGDFKVSAVFSAAHHGTAAEDRKSPAEAHIKGNKNASTFDTNTVLRKEILTTDKNEATVLVNVGYIDKKKTKDNKEITHVMTTTVLFYDFNTRTYTIVDRINAQNSPTGKAGDIVTAQIGQGKLSFKVEEE